MTRENMPSGSLYDEPIGFRPPQAGPSGHCGPGRLDFCQGKKHLRKGAVVCIIGLTCLEGCGWGTPLCANSKDAADMDVCRPRELNAYV